MENFQFYHVDAFTRHFFCGNPAAVCITKKPLPEKLMLNIAAEVNLSETAFIYCINKDIDTYSIRWFTPTTEVKLCGHATLAATHVLYEQNHVTDNKVTYYANNESVLYAYKSSYGITLDFPTDQLIEWKSSLQQTLLSYLGLPHNCPVYYGKLTQQILIEAPSAELVQSLDPNFYRLRSLEGSFSGVAVTSVAENYDFISRFFDPWEGIDEDPVTGSAHTLLTPYWASKLHKKLLTARQESQRGGELVLELKGNRVLISGEATTVFTGAMNINI